MTTRDLADAVRERAELVRVAGFDYYGLPPSAQKALYGLAGQLLDPVADELERLAAKVAWYRDALRYIAGDDVAGYDAHLRPEDVARDALKDENPA